MQKQSRWLIGVGGAVLIIFGLGCLNYTKASAWEHHRQWAIEHNAPPPSQVIFVGGITSVVLGAGLIGLTLRARQIKY